MNRALIAGSIVLVSAGIGATVTAQRASIPATRTVCSRCALLLHAAIETYEKGNLRGATRQLHEAAQHHPGDAKLHFMLGNALYRGGHLREAAEAYDRSLAIQPYDIEALVSVGFARHEIGDRMAAVGHWARAVSLNPQEPLARAALAVGLAGTGELTAAVEQYAMAVTLDPRYGEPDRLAIDIRWKPAARDALRRLQNLSSREPQPE
jgi:tetratricopeptide (TPR) repeat protein